MSRLWNQFACALSLCAALSALSAPLWAEEHAALEKEGMASKPAGKSAVSASPATAPNKAARSFASLRQAFLTALWQQDPDLAMSAGRFSGAAHLPIPDADSRARSVQFAQAWLIRFQGVHTQDLSAQDEADWRMVCNYLEGQIWYFNTFREFEWNPAQYNVAQGLDVLLNTPFASSLRRMQMAIARMQEVPAYYAAAQASLHAPTLEHTRLALRQSKGTLAVLSNMESSAQTLRLSERDRTALTQGLERARAAIAGYCAFLEQQLADSRPEAHRSFRIGAALYEGKFKADIQSSTGAEETYRRALRAKEDTLAKMARLADGLWPRVMGDQPRPQDRLKLIARVIETLSDQHTTAAELLPEIRRQLPALEAWVKTHQLLDIDSKKPLVVRETPEYERGVTVASIEAPGIFRPSDNTYYNVSPLEGVPADQQESTLREYNHWVLQILNIHEAIPGHYTQLQHANQSASVIKTLFGNGAMIEGWAVYSERMMLESGYGADAPEMWLMYYKWHMRAICNTVLDYGVHALNMSEVEAKKLLMEEAFQTQAEADGKWQRVQYTSVQLMSYFSGYSDIMALRGEQQTDLGAAFDLKTFHERLLGYGSAPVSVIRGLMQRTPGAPIARRPEKG